MITGNALDAGHCTVYLAAKPPTDPRDVTVTDNSSGRSSTSDCAVLGNVGVKSPARKFDDEAPVGLRLVR